MKTFLGDLFDTHRGRRLATLMLGVSAASAGSSVAHADEVGHTIRVEGGIAAPVTDPQVDLFNPGGGGALGYELLPVPYVGLEARFSAYWLPVSSSNPSPHDFGTYYAPAIALRLHPLATQGVGDLWLGVGAALVFTGDVVRPGLELGVGYEAEAAWWLRVGPYVRYHHVFQTEPGADAGFVSVGVSMAFGGERPTSAGDRDGDGIIDGSDACPREPEDFDGFQDSDGCPDTDNDGDDVLDACDRCPNEAEDRDDFDDLDGCPDPDNDGDGIADGDDQCPNDAEDADGFQDQDGCPDPDNDGDGILDGADRCPNDPETMNGHEDADGCPDTAPVARTETELQLERIGERIQFAQNSAVLLPASRAAIREVIALLRRHPEVTRVIVEAHSSSEGTADHNMQLSRERGQAVVDALVRGRVDRERVTSRAFGEGRPTVGGGTEAELAPNRRVTFTLETAVQVPATP